MKNYTAARQQGVNYTIMLTMSQPASLSNCKYNFTQHSRPYARESFDKKEKLSSTVKIFDELPASETQNQTISMTRSAKIITIFKFFTILNLLVLAYFFHIPFLHETSVDLSVIRGPVFAVLPTPEHH